jgi:pSer/pThr/pTyr-binding forkhead associated (FHA) protein
MAQVTLQVIEGMEAGQIFRDLPTPITIGREEDNLVQLNDERISRFHVKIQDDSGRLILTDLQSTNGTRVNGHPVTVRVLRLGDQISVGRCVLLVGSPEELAVENVPASSGQRRPLEQTEFPLPEGEEEHSLPAFPHGPPPLPEQLSGLQTAELSDVLEYMRTEVVGVLREVFDSHEINEDLVCLPRFAWHRLQQLAPEISRYQRQLTDPPAD